MASRRPVVRLFAQCKSRSQLSSPKAVNVNWNTRRALSSFPGPEASGQALSPLRRYLGWAAFGVLLTVSLSYKMVCRWRMACASLHLGPIR